ncbi:MAG: hypothetical protein WC679_06550 [Bacteroidales bacterium]|jgi:hypothetical protein
MIDINDYIKGRKCFPVMSLNHQIIEKLEKLDSIGIKNLIEKGLNKTITFTEFQESIKNPAEIKKEISDENHSIDSIFLSAAYCQFLWTISYVALNVYDCNNVNDELKNNPTYKDDLINEREHANKIIVNISSKELKEKCLEVINKVDHIYKYIDKDKVFNECHDVFIEGMKLTDKNNTKIDIKRYYELTSVFTKGNEKVNGIYLYAVLFVLIHEIQHFSLEHLESTIDNEFEADSASFWTLFSDVEENEKTTANIGVLVGLCSLIFINDLDGGGTHPDNDDRIMEVLKNIIEENPHYTGLVTTIFNMWAYYYDVLEIQELQNNTYNSDRDYLDEILGICKKIKINKYGC